MSFIPLKNLLRKTLIKNKISSQVEAALVLEEFNKIVIGVWGPKVISDAKALYVKDKILTLAVISAALATEIKLNKKNIIDSLNDVFDKEVIKDLRILM